MDTRGLKINHRNSVFATHQPVLLEALKRTSGPVIEFGCGFGSTPMLHEICGMSGRMLLSLDSDPAWIGQFVGAMQTDTHRFAYVPDWKAALTNERISGVPWSVVLVDQGSWEARLQTIEALKNKVDYLILHDCDYYPTAGVAGRVIRHRSADDPIGERDYAEIFRYWREYHPLAPWPGPTGPPTLLGSERHVCDWDVDFS